MVLRRTGRNGACADGLGFYKCRRWLGARFFAFKKVRVCGKNIRVTMQHGSMEEATMGTNGRKSGETEVVQGRPAACPLDLPRTGRVPGLLSLAAIPAALLANPLFFALAGGLLGIISLLLSSARCRLPGAAGVLGAVMIIVLHRLPFAG
jgi:hypothetical protein